LENQIEHILVVDDESGIRNSLCKVLEREGYKVLEAENGQRAIKIVSENPVSLIISDFAMPGMDGITLLKSVKDQHPYIEFIMITGHGTIERAVEAIKAGAYDFITKPFKRAELLPIIEKTLEKYNLSKENRYLKKQLAEIESAKHHFIGNSRQAQDVRNLVARIANTPSNILISGESGTGKEVIARMIHNSSDKKDHPFVAVNCGAIPEGLIESELFGHIKGSFTGAIRDKDGLFVVANNGTLLLDEISTVPVTLQVKLLRALEEHEVLPVGATRTLKTNARIVAATNRDLQKGIEKRTFREDLYFRLNVIEIKIPALRERIEDIAILSTFFINRLNKELHKNVQNVSVDVLHLLQSHNWPGNVRELENVIERAMIFCDGETIEPSHLPAMFTMGTTSVSMTLKDSVAEFERKHIRSVLSITNGDKKEAAKHLGLGVSSLYRKISELGLE
jgi:DNA-binding NtrC family response regulator